MALTDRRDILLHMAGLDRSPEPTRNHFAASEGGAAHAALEELKAAGLVRGPWRRPEVYPDMAFYYTTEASVEAARKLQAEGGQPS